MNRVWVLQEINRESPGDETVRVFSQFDAAADVAADIISDYRNNSHCADEIDDLLVELAEHRAKGVPFGIGDMSATFYIDIMHLEIE